MEYDDDTDNGNDEDNVFLFMRSNFSGRATRSCSLFDFSALRILCSILSHGWIRLFFGGGSVVGATVVGAFVGLILNRSTGRGGRVCSRRVKALLFPFTLPKIGRPGVTIDCGAVVAVVKDKDGSDSAKRAY